MRSSLRLLPFLCILLGRRAETRPKYETKLRFEEFGNCHNEPNIPNGFIESGIVHIGSYTVGRGVIRFNHSYTKFTKVITQIERCADKNDPHCQPFTTWLFGEEACKYLAMKDMLWTPLLRTIPQITCPIKKGTYRMENATLDLAKLRVLHFPTSGYYKVRVEWSADNIPKIICSYFELTPVRVRV